MDNPIHLHKTQINTPTNLHETQIASAPIVTRLRDMIVPNASGYYIELDKSPAEITADISEAADLITELVDALRWYAEQVAGCKLIHSGGDVFRNALVADGGNRARAALAKAGGQHERD